MTPEIFFFLLVSVLILFPAVCLVLDGMEERRAWKTGKRFVVRQIEHGIVREWICARYTTSDGKILFRQEGHKQPTVVSGQWNVEPLASNG